VGTREKDRGEARKECGKKEFSELRRERELWAGGVGDKEARSRGKAGSKSFRHCSAPLVRDTSPKERKSGRTTREKGSEDQGGRGDCSEGRTLFSEGKG